MTFFHFLGREITRKKRSLSILSILQLLLGVDPNSTMGPWDENHQTLDSLSNRAETFAPKPEISSSKFSSSQGGLEKQKEREKKKQVKPRLVWRVQ